MVFGEKSEKTYDKSFSSKNLMQYVEGLVREVLSMERRSQNDARYTWLKSSHLDFVSINHIMEEMKPIISKLSPESCASVAVKFDNLTNETVTIASTLCLLKSLLEEQYSIQMIQDNIGDTTRKRRMNRVHPELSPPGRQPVVSFILSDPFEI